MSQDPEDRIVHETSVAGAEIDIDDDGEPEPVLLATWDVADPDQINI